MTGFLAADFHQFGLLGKQHPHHVRGVLGAFRYERVALLSAFFVIYSRRSSQYLRLFLVLDAVDVVQESLLTRAYCFAGKNRQLWIKQIDELAFGCVGLVADDVFVDDRHQIIVATRQGKDILPLLLSALGIVFVGFFHGVDQFAVTICLQNKLLRILTNHVNGTFPHGIAAFCGILWHRHQFEEML